MSTESSLEKVRRLIGDGAEQVGAVAGAVVGWYVGGPDGAVAGAAGGTAVKQVIVKVGADLSDRLFSRRERYRIGTTLGYAAVQIERNFKEGKQPRNDGFFEGAEQERSSGEELLEGVLLKARDAYEERKVRLLGNLFGNIAFDASVPAGEANLILSLVEASTYRELLCIAAIGRISEFDLSTEDFVDKDISSTTFGILHELLDLARRGLIYRQRPGDDTVGWMMEFSVIIPAYLHLGDLGEHMFDLMGMRDIPDEEIESLVAQHLR